MKKKALFFLVFLLGVIFVYGIKSEKETDHIEISLSTKELLLATLENELVDLNRKLPLQLDENTTLISIDIEKEKIVSTHLIKEHLSGKVSPDVVKNLLLPRIIANTCNAEDKKLFINAGVNIILEYLDSNNRILFDVEISSDTCSLYQ